MKNCRVKRERLSRREKKALSVARSIRNESLRDQTLISKFQVEKDLECAEPRRFCYLDKEFIVYENFKPCEWYNKDTFGCKKDVVKDSEI